MAAVLAERQQAVRDFSETITERLLRGAGIRRGMQILDLRCGAGEISLLAARLTGPNGLVLGVDRNPVLLETARQRACQEDLAQVYFLDAPLEKLDGEGPFDAVIGCDVLSGENPVATARQAAGLLRSGGMMAFHESSPAALQVLQEAGMDAPELFGGTVSGRSQFCVWARKP
jgi:ubiquinone/menaquinone biosynthesis C-methylase UbiE